MQVVPQSMFLPRLGCGCICVLRGKNIAGGKMSKGTQRRDAGVRVTEAKF